MALANTRRKEILDRILTLLDGITEVNGFNNNLGSSAPEPRGTISRNVNAIANADANNMPFVTVMFNNMQWTPNVANQSEDVVTVFVFDLYVRLDDDTEVDPYEELDRLLADIESALINGVPASNVPNQFDKVSLQGLSFLLDVQKSSFFNDQGKLATEGHEFAWGRLTVNISYETEVIRP